MADDSKGDRILGRSRRGDRGSRIALLVQQGLSSDDELLDYFDVKKKKKKPAVAAANVKDDDDADDDDSTDSTFSSADISEKGSDKLDSDFGDEEVEGELDSDADSLQGDADVRRQEREEARKTREKKERVIAGTNKSSGTGAGGAANISVRNRPALTTTQAQRMEAAAKWAEQQTEALARREALYNDAERIVRERAQQAIMRRRRRQRQQDGGDAVDEGGPTRPVYFSNRAVLEQTGGFAHVIIYPA